ncbi:DUF7146 domain-containing protein [Acuticoccus kandeliae]|uniref:DUF7146 domain-containing protein n=1 Tax=Acuticoccus kandeliae TaxID=2073160 RepID=UPI003CCBB897
MGHWPASQHHKNEQRERTPIHAVARARPTPSEDREQNWRRIWSATRPASGTLVETYQASRGITLPIPPSIRFHPALRHPSGDSWPCMVAAVHRVGSNEPVAIHRTFLARDGSQKAPVGSAKMMLGPCRGGAVRLAEPGDELMVGEGIETCLSVMQATGKPAWAALCTVGLRALDVPETVTNVIILADGDKPGEAAAQDCLRRWTRCGISVRIARPPAGFDFNDVLLGRHVSTGAGA